MLKVTIEFECIFTKKINSLKMQLNKDFLRKNRDTTTIILMEKETQSDKESIMSNELNN